MFTKSSSSLLSWVTYSHVLPLSSRGRVSFPPSNSREVVRCVVEEGKGKELLCSRGGHTEPGCGQELDPAALEALSWDSLGYTVYVLGYGAAGESPVEAPG